MDEANTLFISVNKMNAFHEQFHNLSANKECAGPAQKRKLPNVGIAASEEIANDALASRRQEADEVFYGIQRGDFGAKPTRGKTNREQQSRKKCEKYVERNGLGNHAAAWKDAAERSKNSFEQVPVGIHPNQYSRSSKMEMSN